MCRPQQVIQVGSNSLACPVKNKPSLSMPPDDGRLTRLLVAAPEFQNRSRLTLPDTDFTLIVRKPDPTLPRAVRPGPY